MEQKQKSRIFFEEDRERLWVIIKEAMLQNKNKKELIEFIGLTPEEFRNIRCHLSLNRKAELTTYFSQFNYVYKSKAGVVKTKIDKLDYNELLEDVKLNKLTKEQLCRKHDISSTTYEKYLKSLQIHQRTELSKYTHLNMRTRTIGSLLPPVNFKKHSGFEMKETTNITRLPIGKLK